MYDSSARKRGFPCITFAAYLRMSLGWKTVTEPQLSSLASAHRLCEAKAVCSCFRFETIECRAAWPYLKASLTDSFHLWCFMSSLFYVAQHGLARITALHCDVLLLYGLAFPQPRLGFQFCFTHHIMQPYIYETLMHFAALSTRFSPRNVYFACCSA
ncbi:hypothetical protein HDV63DRAFT_377829 [Trichoderma sp. SZMC 28014]